MNSILQTIADYARLRVIKDKEQMHWITKGFMFREHESK